MAPDTVRGGDSGHDKVCSVFDTSLYIAINCIIRILANNLGRVFNRVLFLVLPYLYFFSPLLCRHEHIMVSRVVSEKVIERLGHSGFPFFQGLLLRIIFCFTE